MLLVNWFKPISLWALMLLALMSSQNSFASVPITTDSVNTNWFLLFPLPISQCNPDGICTGIDGYWTTEVWPSFQIGQTVNLTVSSLSGVATSFGFSLGNTLSGLYRVSLTSETLSGTTTANDVLKTAVYDKVDFLGISQAGILLFDAKPGVEYFVFLGGLMQEDQSYELQISSIPLPTGFGLFLSGLVFCWVFAIGPRRAVNTISDRVI